ncbi:MAG: hypothetical protein IJG82_09440 [Atopobiaceae bacterium]|nr:hypothetical protein [Atopobiaceae bacterium]
MKPTRSTRDFVEVTRWDCVNNLGENTTELTITLNGYDHNMAMILNAVRNTYRMNTKRDDFGIKRVIFNDPATIVYWNDGTKTVVRCQEGDAFNEEVGLLMCIAKKAYGNKGAFNDIIKAWAKLGLGEGESDE